MKFSEKTALGVIVSGLAVSFALYGVWLEKIWLLAPVLMLVYLSVSVWLVASVRDPRTQRSEHGTGGGAQTADLRPLSSDLRIPPGGIPLLLFWLYSFALIPFSALPYEAKISVLGFGGYLCIYWASANVLSRFSYRKAVWITVFVLLVFTALYSLVQHKVAPGRIFGIERYTTYWEGGRLGGSYQCPNHIAHLFQMWLPLCLVFLFIPQFGWFWRICFAYALPLFLLLIYQTQSRAGLLGSVAAVGVTALMTMLRKSRRAFYIALLVVPLLGAGAVGGLWAGSAMFRERMQPVVKFAGLVFSGQGIDENFIDFRPLTWLDTIKMIKDRPVFGFGPGNYGLMFEDYRQRCKAVRVETVHPHNEYLELISEYGAVGGLLVLGVLISFSVQMSRFIRTSPRPYHALPAAALLGALAGSAVHGFFDFELRIFPNAMMLALLAGCAAAPLMQTVPSKRLKLNRSVQWIFVIAVVLATLWTVQVMSSAWMRARGDTLLEAQHFLRAENSYKMAERIDRQNWLAQLGLGQVYYHYRYNELDAVRKRELALKELAVYETAYRTNTKKEEIVYGLGRVELFLGNRDKGLDYLRQAANYKRFNDYYWRKLGIELRKAGLYDEALSAFEYAQKLDRSNKTVKRNIEWLKQRKSAGK
jgi:O-antigen ligase